jgi:hypothetical protein
VVEKAVDLVCPILGEERGRRLVDTILDLDRVGSVVGTLRPLLAGA